MKKTNATQALLEEISLLENRQTHQLNVLKEQFHLTFESLKPINLIKSTMQEVGSSPDVRGKIVNNVIGLFTGYLSRRVLMGNSRNPVKRVLGIFLQFAVANFIAKNSETIKRKGGDLLQLMLKQRRKKETIEDYL